MSLDGKKKKVEEGGRWGSLLSESQACWKGRGFLADRKLSSTYQFAMWHVAHIRLDPSEPGNDRRYC